MSTEKEKSTLEQKNTFSFYCDEWLHFQQTQLKEASYVKYAMVLERYMKPVFGKCVPLEITTRMIDDFTYYLMFEKNLSAKTVRDILTVFRGILKYIRRVSTEEVPSVEISYPKIEKKNIRVLSKTEELQLVSYLMKDMDFCKFGVLLTLFTGMRIGELCALQWEKISFVDNTLWINTTLQRLHNTEENQKMQTKILIDTPKTSTSLRVIPLTDYMVKLCRKMDPENPSAYLLTGTEKYMEPRTLQYRLKKYTRECGLDGVHFHTLRHTFATRAVEAGFEIKCLSEILGHATTTITLNRYVHASMDLKRDNMEKLSRTQIEFS